MSQECWYNSHFCDNHGFPFRIHRCLSKETKKTRNEYKLSLIMTFISKFYLYKCSHCLGSQACTCSCKSQECWYSSHLRHTDEFYPCIRPGLKKRKENNTSHQPRTSYINLDIQRKKIINFVACWLLQVRLIVSLIARRASINTGGVLSIMASTGKLRPNCKRCTSSRLQVYERV